MNTFYSYPTRRQIVVVWQDADGRHSRALQLVGFSEDVARVFGGGAERSAVVTLAQQRRLVI